MSEGLGARLQTRFLEASGPPPAAPFSFLTRGGGTFLYHVPPFLILVALRTAPHNKLTPGKPDPDFWVLGLAVRVEQASVLPAPPALNFGGAPFLEGQRPNQVGGRKQRVFIGNKRRSLAIRNAVSPPGRMCSQRLPQTPRGSRKTRPALPQPRPLSLVRCLGH